MTLINSTALLSKVQIHTGLVSQTLDTLANVSPKCYVNEDLYYLLFTKRQKHQTGTM